jgi:hypothetical protein
LVRLIQPGKEIDRGHLHFQDHDLVRTNSDQSTLPNERRFKMKASRLFIVSVVSVVLLLALTVGLSVAQGPDRPQGSTGVTATAPGAIPIQGKLTDASGAPLNGIYTLTFRLYDDAAAVSALCADVRPVQVTNGLFSDYMDHCYDDINGQKLWLGIQVGSDPEMTPRQVIYPVPYALSLGP